jgi:phage gp29-like protein
MAGVTLYGPDNRPIQRKALLTEDGGPTVTGVRQVVGDHPEAGLTPVRLAAIMRDAEEGDPTSLMELAEAVEEKYLHYQGVLGTRKRAVARLPVTVEAATDDAWAVEDADLVREWLRRDTWRGEAMELLDSVGKGYSFTEINWETTGGRWWPARLEWRDPRWFAFDMADGTTPRIRGEGGQLEALAPYKWVCHQTKTKSGTPVRAGLIRGVAWVYLFQAFGWKDWLVFLNRFGQPFRLGKYGAGATPTDKDQLLRAIRALSGDFGGIIPESMAIELIEAKVTGNVQVFKDLINEADTRVSIAVLGQNLTTKVEGGSRAASETHNDVRGDIRDADASDLAVTLNRDIVRPLIDLNKGPRPAYPRLVIAEPDNEDLKELRESLQVYVPMGLKVGVSTIRDKLGLPDPDADEEVLTASAAKAAVEGSLNGPGASTAPSDVSVRPKDGDAHQRGGKTPDPKDAHGARSGQPDAIQHLTEAEVGEHWEPLIDPIITRIEQMVAQCHSAEEFLARLPGLAADLPVEGLADSLARTMFAAHLAGQAGDDIGNG